MVDFIRSLLDSDSLSPHGICLLWRPELIWTHVISDALIAGAYLSIPIALGYLVAKRKDIEFGWVFWCFVIFILACGTTHVLSIVTLWWPIYGWEAIVKATTALASVATAMVLWPLIPRILELPSPRQLRVANLALKARVEERDRAIQVAQRANAERLDAEEMLRQSQKMEAIGQLTGGMAHDFNNLLNIVVANLERIERQLPVDSPLHRSIEDAMAGVDRGAALTHKLLGFARKQPMLSVEIDVNPLLDGLSDLLHGALDTRTVLTMSLAPDLLPVQADPNQMENAILNLAVNARDAMDRNRPSRLEIKTRNVTEAEAARTRELDPDQKYIVIEVTDTGIGMPEEVARRAFEPFFTTKPAGQVTGLGLSQVFGFIKQSGGHAIIDSKPGVGTRVKLFIPGHKPIIQHVTETTTRVRRYNAFSSGVATAS